MRPMLAVNNADRLDRDLFNILILLFCVSFFNESPVRLLYYVGTGALFLIPVLVLFRFICLGGNIFKGRKTLAGLFLLFLLVQLAGTRQAYLLSALKSIYRTISLFLITVYAQETDFRKFNFNTLHGCTFFLMLTGYVTLFLFTENNTNICFGNLNTVGVLYFTVALLYFCLRNRMDRVLYYLFQANFLLLILISNTRTALLLYVLFFALCFAFGHFRVKRLKPLFVLSLAVVAGFIFLYYNIHALPIYTWLDELSMRIFDKHIDSGRPRLWQLTVATVGEKWLFGLGTGFELSDTSPHSSYFDFYMQNGAAGVALFVAIVWALFSAKGKAAPCRQNKGYVMIVFVILFYNALGLVISRPGSASGLLMWLLLSLPFIARKRGEVKIYAHKPDRSDL